MSPAEVAAIHPGVPRVEVTDGGDVWTWTSGGRKHSRSKTLPGLPCLHHEHVRASRHQDWWEPTRQQPVDRLVLLIPPTWPPE